METAINPIIPPSGVPSLPQLIKLYTTSKPKLIIPLEVEKKIRQLCSKIHEVEWSGTLFYRYKGTWDNLEITCIDIHLMDIGSAAYTEFDVEPSVIAYMCDHPELMDCQMGLIHSHNNMAK